MLSARLIRIRCGPLRAALWTAWFPCVALDYMITMGAKANPRNLLPMYLIGIDGIQP